jgi:hypothetical protein
MARTIPMPTTDELPDGPRREFVTELRRYWRAAGRPALRKISRAIEGRTDLKEVTASQETIRRMLRGTTLPLERDRVYAVFHVLCEMGDIDPKADRWDGRYDDDSETNWEYLHRLWDTALEEDADPAPLPRPAPAQPDQPATTPRGGQWSGSSDPWSSQGQGSAATGGFSDEPPF